MQSDSTPHWVNTAVLLATVGLAFAWVGGPAQAQPIAGIPPAANDPVCPAPLARA